MKRDLTMEEAMCIMYPNAYVEPDQAVADTRSAYLSLGGLAWAAWERQYGEHREGGGCRPLASGASLGCMRHHFMDDSEAAVDRLALRMLDAIRDTAHVGMR